MSHDGFILRSSVNEFVNSGEGENAIIVLRKSCQISGHYSQLRAYRSFTFAINAMTVRTCCLIFGLAIDFRGTGRRPVLTPTGAGQTNSDDGG
jgi:hypothetical protein